jgi:hypothetical protein
MADNLTSATIDVRANTRGMEKDILKALRTVEFSQVNTKKSSQALGRITGQVSEFNKSLEASNARVVAFGASAGAIFAVEKAFSSLISSTIEVEKKLTDINVILGLSSSGLEKFGDSLFGVAKNTAQSFTSVADAAIELSRQGLGVEETLKRTNAALILTRLSGLDAKSSVEALTATLNSFAGSALDAVEVVNKLANVDAAFAVSSADLANAISRVGSTAVDAGVSLDELIALVTSAQQTTARGGSVIGNSFKTIFTRLQRGKVQDLLGSLGVDTSETQSAISLLQQLATTYDTLGATQRAYVAEQVGGVFQINILRAALSDLGKEYSIFGRALDTSLSSTDQAIRRNELLNQTVSALSTQAVANLEQAANKIGSIVFEPNAKSFLSGFNNILNSFNNIDAESAGGKLMTGFFKGIGDFISGPGAVLTTAVVVKLFATLSKFASGSIRELLGVNKAAQQQAGIEQSILSILQKNNQFTSQILSGKITTVQAEKELLNYLTAQSNILREQERLSKVIGANLAKAGISIGASGVPMAAAAAKGKKAASSGYVPNFAADQVIGQAMENSGAKQHGYKAGKARKTTIHDGNGKSFKSFVNSKEDVKTFTNAAGKKATIVRPPNGFGENTQYAAGGFVPNFIKESIADRNKKGIDFERSINFVLSGLYEDAGPDLLDYPYGGKLMSATPEVKSKARINSLSRYGDAKYSNSNTNVRDFIKKITGSLDRKNILELINLANKTKLQGINLNRYLPATPSLLNWGEGKDSRKKTATRLSTVVANLARLRNDKALPKLTEKGSRVKLFLDYLDDKVYYKKGFDEPNLAASGFIPNFGSKMQELFKNIKMREGQDDPFKKRAQKANLAAKKGIPLKNLGKLDYTMIHAGGGGNFDLPADYLKEDRKTKEKTQYTAKITTAGLDPKKIMGGSVENRVGDALVTEANNLAKTFNPSGGTQFSNYKQLSNTGSVFSAAGTVFESAVRQAFNVPAQGQGDRIDFPSPNDQLRSFFGNATGPYEAKISNTADNRSSTLSKWVAVKGLGQGFVPNFAGSRSGGLSFVQKDKDEFGFSELQAIMGGKRVGSFSYAEDKPGRLDVGDFTVNKSERGRGIGSELYKEAIRRNAGKKMKGQLLPQMNRLLQKIKKGEPVSAETLYPQIKRADLAKSSVFEVYGHKGMTVEKMNRDQFASFVNAKITELKKDPKKLQSYFGNVEADEYGGLGVDLQTQHSSGFVPNFASGIITGDVIRGNEYKSVLDFLAKTNKPVRTIIGPSGSGKTTMASKSGGSIVKSFNDLAGFDSYILDRATMSMPKDEIVSENLKKIFRKSGESGALDLLVGSRNTIKSLREKRAQEGDLLIPDRKQLSSGSGGVSSFVKGARGFASEYPGASVSRIFKDKSEYKTKKILSGGFVPNFASPKLIEAINKRIRNPNIAQKLQEGAGLKDAAYLKAASRLGVNVSGLDYLSPQMGFPLKGKDKVLKLSKALGFGFGRSFAIDALKMGDWNYVKSQFESAGLTQDDFVKLSKFANTSKGENALRWWKSPSLSKASGFVPNFAKASGRTFNSFLSSKNTSRFVHPLNPKFSPQGAVSFPDLEKLKGSVKIIWREAMQGQDVLSLSQFKEMAALRASKPEWWKRNSFEYIYNSGGFVPNFASALNDAIAREKSAGLSSSQIYVDQHSSLKNSKNPMGLMVANTRDEPISGKQGINRAKKEGRNPKTYSGGMSSGFVPNFALFGPNKEEKLELDSLQKSLDELENKIKQAASDFSNPEKKAERLERRKSKLESINYGAVSTSETRAAESKLVKARELRDRLAQKGDMSGAQRAQALVQSAQSEVSKLDKELYKKIKDRIKSIDAQIAASKPSVDAYRSEQAALSENVKATRQQLESKKKETSFTGKAKNFFKGNALSVGFGLQAISGAVGQVAGADQTTPTGKGIAAFSQGIGTVAGFAGTGAMFGPIGAAIGTAVGVTKAFSDGIKIVNSKIPEMEKAFQASSDATSRFGESGQKILQLNEQYADALNSGSPNQAAEIMAKTQKAYAEELSKLTQTQRESLVSAIAQGKGQEGYAKILAEMQDAVKSQESALLFKKFEESESIFGGPDKKIVEGLDKSLVQDLTRGLDASAIQSAIDKASSSLENQSMGTEQRAMALMSALAQSESLTVDQKGNFQKIIDSFASAASKTDLGSVAEGFIEGIKLQPKVFEDVQKFQEAAKKNQQANAAKIKEEIAIREKANASLLKLQSETEAVYAQYSNSLRAFVSSIETAATMRANAGQFKQDFYTQANVPAAAESQNERNIVQASRDQLTLNVSKSQLQASDNFNSAVQELISGLDIDIQKLGPGASDLDKQGQLREAQLSLQKSLLPIQSMVMSGDYEGAIQKRQEAFAGLSESQIALFGSDSIARLGQQLDGSLQKSAQELREIKQNSQKDLAIQAQQLVFQKAMNKLNQAQNFGGAPAKDIITNEPNTPANRALEAINNLKMLGYSQSKLRQGEVRGGTKETWGIDGKKPNAAMSGEVIDFYQAMSELTGQPVISTESKDFKALVQALSEQQRANLDNIAKASGGVVDPMIAARAESTLATLGGDNKVAQLKMIKQLGAADVGGKQILDEALKTYTGGAFAGLSPELKTAFEETTDEGAAATLLLVARQDKQTESLSQGFEAVVGTGIETNGILAQQPAAIAQAIGAILEKGRSEEKLTQEGQKAKDLNKEFINTSDKIQENSKIIKENEQQVQSAESVLGKVPEGISTEEFIKQQETSIDKDEVEKAKKLVGNYSRGEGLSAKDQWSELLAGVGNQALGSSALVGEILTAGQYDLGSSYRFKKADENYAAADGASPETLKAEYDKALELVQRASALDTLKASSDVVKSKTVENEGLSKAQQETVKKQNESAERIKIAQQDLGQKTTQANISKSRILDSGGAAGLQFIEDGQKARAAKQVALAQSLAIQDTSKTERQQQAVKRSTAKELTISPYSGQLDTYENIAVTKSGGANAAAFAELQKQNVLPSLEKFSGVYESMGAEGGAAGAYKKLKSEMFGIPAAANQVAPAQARVGVATSETGQKVATAINEGIKKASIQSSAGGGVTKEENKALLTKYGYTQGEGFKDEESKKAYSAELESLKKQKASEEVRKTATQDIQKTEQEKQPEKTKEVQQDTSQIVANILTTVQQIATELQNKTASAATETATDSKKSSANQSSAGNEISVNNQVSLTVNSANGQGGDAATAIAEQIKIGLSSFLSSPEFIGKVTSIANQAAGNKVPPKVLPA